MSGWSPKKRRAVEQAFYIFLNRCYVNSKDDGRVCLGEVLYEGQRRAITQIFDALEEGIHVIYVLKSRQLGISTIIRALVIFLLGVHNGLKGAIVFDTDNNKSESRAEIEVMINDLPASLKFPSIVSNNRAGLTLGNDSKVLFMSAGVKKSKTSGTLGRSVGLTIAHCSELCSWDNDEGLEAFQQSLSDVNPDRLYIYESTARGFNRWWEMWKEARLDVLHCKCIFLGWWSKDSQRIDRSEMDFKFYGEQVPTEKEFKKIREVKELYGHEVTPEQLAWIRRKMNPVAKKQGDADAEYEGSSTRVQEQPWVEEEAFQQTGAVFFSADVLTDVTNKFVSDKFKTYMFQAGSEFASLGVYRAANARSIELKVWEEPEPSDACYTIGVDPAYGENENNDRSSIQVLRCYADGVDQVAEYAWPLVTTRQLAWVIAALMGWYGQNNNEVRYILEINGPGTAVFNELRSLKFQIENDKRIREAIDEKGLRNIFQNVRTYIYTRPDSMGSGYNYHFLTNTRLKITLLERLRDHVSRGIVRVRSLDMIGEMKSISREGDSIGAQGTMKDDRVLALALATHCWEERAQRELIATRRTRESVEAKRRESIVDQVALFNRNHLDMFFAAKRSERASQARIALRNAWRSGGRRF